MKFRSLFYLWVLLPLLLIAQTASAQTMLCSSESTECVVPNDFSVGDDLRVGGDVTVVSPKGSTATRVVYTALVSPLSGATTAATSLIPAGTLVEGCVARVTTLITGATTWTFGDGTTATAWGTGLALAVGTKTTSANWVASTTVATSHPLFYAAAMSPTLTATGSNFTAGAVRVECYATAYSGPTS